MYLKNKSFNLSKVLNMMGQGHFKRQNIVGATSEKSSLLLGIAWLKIALSSLGERRSDMTPRPAVKQFVQESLSPSMCVPLDLGFFFFFFFSSIAFWLSCVADHLKTSLVPYALAIKTYRWVLLFLPYRGDNIFVFYLEATQFNITLLSFPLTLYISSIRLFCRG